MWGIGLLVHIQAIAFVCHNVEKERLLFGTAMVVLIYGIYHKYELTRVNVHQQ